METSVFFCFLVSFISLGFGSQYICPMSKGYGRVETEAKTSYNADTDFDCMKSAMNGTADWVSFDTISHTCRLYGKVDMTTGVVDKAAGTVKHYSTSACQLNGCGVSSEYMECLKFFDGRLMDPAYSGMICQRGPWGHSTWGIQKKSGIQLRKAGGPINKITIYYSSTSGFSMKIKYGSQEGSYGLGLTGQSYEVEPVAGDCINRIEVKTATNNCCAKAFDDIYQLTFHTSNGNKFGPYGQDKGTLNEAKAPEGTCLSFVDTYTGNWINGIAFTFEPTSGCC